MDALDGPRVVHVAPVDLLLAPGPRRRAAHGGAEASQDHHGWQGPLDLRDRGGVAGVHHARGQSLPQLPRAHCRAAGRGRPQGLCVARLRERAPGARGRGAARERNRLDPVLRRPRASLPRARAARRAQGPARRLLRLQVMAVARLVPPRDAGARAAPLHQSRGRDDAGGGQDRRASPAARRALGGLRHDLRPLRQLLHELAAQELRLHRRVRVLPPRAQAHRGHAARGQQGDRHGRRHRVRQGAHQAARACAVGAQDRAHEDAAPGAAVDAALAVGHTHGTALLRERRGRRQRRRPHAEHARGHHGQVCHRRRRLVRRHPGCVAYVQGHVRGTRLLQTVGAQGVVGRLHG
mmetsp:Transcript_28191/g.67123  ORF Transcript_28191/g.67123 Transcript_28191/m.67123 type:complete len:351 (-) Transcript_28191:914-1966(-)